MAHRPNILYIHSHDTGRYIQPYGYQSPTPNLQKLAEAGVLFRQAFCAAPTCSPSRAAMLTGQSAHNSGMLGLAHRGFSLRDVTQHLQYTLKKHGYYTVLAGLQHITHFGKNDWEDLGYDTGLDDIQAEDEIGRPDRHSTTHLRAAAFLESEPEEPFFLNVGFIETHRPFYDPNMDELPYIQAPRPLPDSAQTREDMSAFIETTKIYDRKVGVVLDALEKSGLADRTLVICTTDHGIPFPFMKCQLTDHGTGVLMILKDQALFSGGRALDALVSQIDLFPTICDYLDIDPPDWLQGRSLLPILRGETEEVNEQVFAEVTFHAAYEPQRMVRTKRWKYIRRFGQRTRPTLPNIDDGSSKSYLLAHGLREHPIDQEMLFDLVFDPNETNNLAQDPDHRAILGDLRKRLKKWMEDTQDPLLTQEVVPLPEGAVANDPDADSPNDWEPISQEEHLSADY
jgi:N-sulfoglucosamine sulfohydrolase